ncbi:ABC transporter ATP-binding protein, partial [Erysipelothrix rhusiopathiae]|nr:ABC transporter ATP-binding protein [Erysipelothrix rhusiopathiae]
ILLDEPTSNLDSLNEAIILKSIVEYKYNKTIVIVSHRASTLKIADEVWNLEDGKLNPIL